MNPNYLLKQEIDYELRVRGINITGGVEFLQKLFRLVMTETVAIRLQNLGDFDPQEHLQYITSKTQELEVSPIGPRLRTRVRHFSGRLTQLLKWNMLPKTVSVSAIRDLITRLEALERRAIHCVSNLSEDGAVSERVMQQDTGTVRVRVQADATEHTAQLGGPDVATSIQETRRELFREANSDIRGKVSSLDNSIAGEKVLVLPWHFKNLPHPAERILRELPSVNGLDVNLLLQFLTKILEIRAVFTVTDQVLLQEIYPYCKEPLSNHVQQALNNGRAFDQLHEDIILSFIPRRRFDHLREERVARLQREEESLSAYSNAVKKAAQVLRLSLSDAEIVANIVDGLSKTQHSRLIFKIHLQLSEIWRSCVFVIRMCLLMIML
jgi:hypothetical protein